MHRRNFLQSGMVASLLATVGIKRAGASKEPVPTEEGSTFASLPDTPSSYDQAGQAVWDKGVDSFLQIDNNRVWLSCSPGSVYQFSRQEFTGIDMQRGDLCYVANRVMKPYAETSDLSDQICDSRWHSLVNRSFTFVFWGVANGAGQKSHLLVNLPRGSYPIKKPDDAVFDAELFNVYDWPERFNGMGFLIAAYTMTLDRDGQWGFHKMRDLRGCQRR